MALTRTTLSGAITANDTQFAVASATGFAVGEYLRVDDEFMLTTAVSGTNISVMRGQNGSAAVAHPTSAGVVTGTGSEFTGSAVATSSTYPLAGRQRRVASYSASGAITLPTGGTDVVAVLNGTSVLAMTVADPTTDMDGALLWIAGNGTAAHTVTFSSGLSGEGGSYDVITANASGPVLLGPFMAVNGFWYAPVAVAMTGTVTNITAGLA